MFSMIELLAMDYSLSQSYVIYWRRMIFFSTYIISVLWTSNHKWKPCLLFFFASTFVYVIYFDLGLTIRIYLWLLSLVNVVYLVDVDSSNVTDSSYSQLIKYLLHDRQSYRCDGSLRRDLVIKYLYLALKIQLNWIYSVQCYILLPKSG
jgi:hypothetical protein